MSDENLPLERQFGCNVIECSCSAFDCLAKSVGIFGDHDEEVEGS